MNTKRNCICVRIIKNFFSVEVCIIMKVLGNIVLYFVLIFSLSWLGGKLFYDFDEAIFLLFDGHIFKGLCTLLIMYIAYFIAAGMACANNDEGKTAGFVIFAILVFFVGSDVYELYHSSRSTVEGVSNAFLYLLVSVDDVLKIITLFQAMKS